MKDFFKSSGVVPSVAIFLSGGGTNAETLLTMSRAEAEPTWAPVALVTDRPDTSRARELAARFALPLIEHDIRAFYRARGENRVTLATAAGREIRAAWTDALREKLKPYRPDFGVLAGFVPLSNITGDFPCLNVHPGDLTVEENGRRLLVGLHELPIETALTRGHEALRASVIVAQPYTGAGGEMDSGPILGVSGPVPVDRQGYSREDLWNIAAARPPVKPVGGYGDALERIARANQERLKENGDWVVLPAVVRDFARGVLSVDKDGLPLYEKKPVRTVEYDRDGVTPWPR